MRNSVTQEDLFGCGIACVAFTTHTTYKNAKKKYFKNVHRASNFGFICKDLVKALSIAGKKYAYKYVKRRIKFKEGMIIFIKRSRRYPVGHYLVKTKNGWMDPWINHDIKNPDIKYATSGFRKRLPGKPIYVIFPVL